MSDTVLSATAVKLFGRPVAGLNLDLDLIKAGKVGAFLKGQLGDDAHLALVYGYSYQGQYNTLVQPAIFLVHGEGSTPGKDNSTASTGIAAKSWDFEPGIVFWEYDPADFSLRLDIDSGPLERILIEAERQDGDMPYFRGAHTRFRGAHTRLRGLGE